MLNEMLLAHNFMSVPEGSRLEDARLGTQLLGTVFANMAYYGFVPSVDAVTLLRGMTDDELAAWWGDVEPGFKAATGADRQMGDFVVYKNFPREVLEMSHAEYWTRQILVYLGAPFEWYASPVEERPELDERLRLRVLQPARPETLRSIYEGLLSAKHRWTQAQREHAQLLIGVLKVEELALRTFGFKENGLNLIAANPAIPYAIVDATDVVRLAAAMNAQDVSLRKNVKFSRFGRSTRRKLLAALEASPHLESDVARRPELFKKFLAVLHPGDYRFEQVGAVYDKLYRGELTTYESRVEAALQHGDASILAQVASQPGDFVRRLHKLYAVFGAQAIEAFIPLAASLTTLQLLKLRTYVATVNDRGQFVYAPRGNWSKAQIAVKTKAPFIDVDAARLLGVIDETLAVRLKPSFPDGVKVDLNVADIKLPTNDQELAPYGRGTVFKLPENVRYLRTASYWEQKTDLGHNWFDNGWTFHDENWASRGACCWTDERFGEDAAIYAGDPGNGGEERGRACEMIDLNLEALVGAGVRYAVWSVLSYSRIAFGDATDVLATLQWGENAEEGELYEPSRAQMVFPLKGNTLVKYVAYLDLAERKLVYMDANLPGTTQSASINGEEILVKQMPAFVEYLRSLPSVADLFANVAEGTMPVMYSDEGYEIKKGEKAFVFQPTNPENSFEQFDLQAVL